MSPNARALILGVGLLATIGGAVLTALADGAGLPMLVLGLLVLVGTLFERRYGRQGLQRSVPHGDWQLTDERFIDDETGEKIEVWIDPLTGERRYEPMNDHPRIADPRTHRPGSR